MTFIGAVSGTLLVQHIQSGFLRQVLPLLIIGIGLYFLLMPRTGEDDRQRRLDGIAFALVAGGAVGFTTVFRSGRRLFLCAGVRDAGWLQPGEIHRARQGAEFHL